MGTQVTRNEAAERLLEYVDTLRTPDVLLTEQYRMVQDHLDKALAAERRAAGQCDGYAGDPGASAPRCESYAGHPGPHFIRHDGAAERRATVERIRERLSIDGVVQNVGGVYLAKILDEEAAR